MRALRLILALVAFLPLLGCVETAVTKELITEVDPNGKILKQIYTESLTQQGQMTGIKLKYLKIEG